MSDISKKKQDIVLKEEDLDKILKGNHTSLVKMDLGPLESVLRFISASQKSLVK